MSWPKLVRKQRAPAIEPKRDTPFEMPSRRLGPQLASEITFSFDEAKIPSFVWDWIESSPISEHRHHMGIEFVVPDHLLLEAQKVLVKAGFRPCPAQSECHMFHEFPFKSLPTSHFHHINFVEEVISLRRLSSLAVSLHLTLNEPGPDDPDFMLSSDARLGASAALFAPLRDRMHPFKLLTPISFAECLILQACRGVDVEDQMVVRGYLLRLMYLKEHGEGPNGSLGPEDLHVYLRPFWSALGVESDRVIIAHLRRLKFHLNKMESNLPTPKRMGQRRQQALKDKESLD